MTAKAAAGFTLRTDNRIECGEQRLLPALGAALLMAGAVGQVCSAMGMPVDGLFLLAGAAAAASLLITLPTILVYLLMQTQVMKTMLYAGIK